MAVSTDTKSNSVLSEDAKLVEVLTRIETKLDSFASHVDDHETRIRTGEEDRAQMRSELNARVRYRDLWPEPAAIAAPSPSQRSR